ncbi:hypothetical protein [Achromobacter ruhlandii]|uniref:hypothetical protein n=1 Tax=Achromobacter ruhlandii TaxID=72557 RepID=UPI0007BF833D|nr:hypothetical protein [Achromobacter ruhlandii]
MECCYINGWEPNRDDGFLHYLLGKVADRDLKREDAAEVGQWAAYSLLCGETLAAAFAFGRAVFTYNRSLSSLARRIARAVAFVAEDIRTADLHGKPVVTMQDMFNYGRKFNVSVVHVEQSRDRLLAIIGEKNRAKARP